jgi:hypothetical protein
VGNLIRATLIQVNTPKGKAAPKFKPAKRPRTAEQRAAKLAELAIVDEIIAEARPDLAKT